MKEAAQIQPNIQPFHFIFFNVYKIFYSYKRIKILRPD